jgi:hypothetical protein
MILFEIIIGLGLLSALLSLLFSFFSSSAKMDQKIERAQHALLERQHLQNRLQSVLTSIVPDGEGSSLYTKAFKKNEDSSLVVFFDNGIDPDPQFSGPTLARIFIEQDCLCLALWPQDRDKMKKGPVRQEILLHNVSSFSFRFLVKNIDRSIEWKKEWPKKESWKIPSIICLDLWQGIDKNEEPNLNLAFILPSQEPPIYYGEKKSAS